MRYKMRTKKKDFGVRGTAFSAWPELKGFLLTSLSPSPAETNKLLLVSAGSCWMGRKRKNPSDSLRRRQKWEPPACTWEFDGCGWSARDNAGRRYRRRSARVRNMQTVVAKKKEKKKKQKAKGEYNRWRMVDLKRHDCTKRWRDREAEARVQWLPTSSV